MTSISNSNFDPLTGLGNRAALDRQLAAMIAADQPFGLVLSDIDNFRPINERLGHVVGDRFLVAAAQAFAAACPDPAFAYRSGGEEFVALLPGADAPTTLAIAECLSAAASAVEVAGDKLPHLSVGTATFPADSMATTERGPAEWRPPGAEGLLLVADRALHRAKRDQVSRR